MPAIDLDFSIETKPETMRVCSLHAFAYCPRLFYLEEVEELYTQDAAVFAGRRLHEELEKQEDEEWEDLYLESEELGLRGRVDALRTREGQLIPYEHKRGRAHRDEDKQAQAWESDKLQILAYAYLMESALNIPLSEGRIRYHADNVLVHVPLDDEGKAAVREAIHQARLLRQSSYRPPVTENERLCARCWLSQREREKLRWELEKILTKEDDLLLIRLSSQCVHDLPKYNRPHAWSGDESSYRIL